MKVILSIIWRFKYVSIKMEPAQNYSLGIDFNIIFPITCLRVNWEQNYGLFRMGNLVDNIDKYELKQDITYSKIIDWKNSSQTFTHFIPSKNSMEFNGFFSSLTSKFERHPSMERIIECVKLFAIRELYLKKKRKNEK